MNIKDEFSITANISKIKILGSIPNTFGVKVSNIFNIFDCTKRNVLSFEKYNGHAFNPFLGSCKTKLQILSTFCFNAY